MKLVRPTTIRKTVSEPEQPIERIAGEATVPIAPSENFFMKGLLVGALFILPLLLYVLYYKSIFPGLINNGAMDYAQLGRNLAEGRGFTTFYLRPLALTHGDNPFRQPEVVNAPLFPLLLALAFGIRGATDAVVAQVSGLFYLLTVPVVYLLGKQVFSRNVGLIAAAIFTANPLMLEYAISGLPITLQTFLMTCLLLSIHTLSEQVSKSVGNPVSRTALVAIGVMTGMLYLTDTMLLIVMPAVAIAVVAILSGQGRRALGWFALPLVFVVAPWMARLGHLTGNPFYGLRGMEVWMGTKDVYPGSIAYRFDRTDLIPGVGLFNAVVKKMLFGAGQVVEAFPQVSASWMLAFLLPSLLFRFQKDSINRLRNAMMSCFIAILIGLLPFGVDMPMFASLVPAMLVFAIAYLLRLVNQSQLSRASILRVTSLLVMAILLPILRSMVLTDRPTAVVGKKPALALKKLSGDKDVVLSDQPWVVAWYANRPSIWIPSTDAKVGAYRKKFPRVQWLFLTDQVTGFSQEWQGIYSEFYRWNLSAVDAQRSGTQSIGSATISGTNNELPLLEILQGFTSFEPALGSSPTVVIAGIPR